MRAAPGPNARRDEPAMIVIGLVGRIGAGKSTVAALFAARGGVVVDADRLAHEALAEPAVVAAVVGRFGSDVLDEAGAVRRATLAERVFGGGAEHDRNRQALEAIIHPRVRSRIETLLAEQRAAERLDGRRRVVVLDVPLLVQAGLVAVCDRIVIVECDEAVRRARLTARGWTDAQRKARDGAWEAGYALPRGTGQTVSVVDASRDRAYTSLQVDGIWDELPGT